LIRAYSVDGSLSTQTPNESSGLPLVLRELFS